ncbi:dihydroneopterin aldolase [Maritalea porphyrae]|jgi:dihydroneopterin aldolase|uniref:dihydroneopterin aldolase n=1 Tax=Maritalea porphyrae TaxID=880732 RepID=UPI0022AFDA6E|nr:dihydroneopterin aldolase [Maritalea porphyrae]MCZ4272883.1 dihydroneopterin aldolase [Maritalea porphyrae]
MPKTNRTEDKIVLADLAFYGYHGVMQEENALGQRFRIDLECGVDLSKPGLTDDVEDTISYDQIFNLVNERVTQTRFKLIEALGQHLIDGLFDTFETIEWVRVRVRKPEAPIPVVTGEFAIELVRDRETK